MREQISFPVSVARPACCVVSLLANIYTLNTIKMCETQQKLSWVLVCVSCGWVRGHRSVRVLFARLPETLKALSRCVSVADESASDPWSSRSQPCQMVHKHTHHELDISGSATHLSLRGNSFCLFYILFPVHQSSALTIDDNPLHLVLCSCTLQQRDAVLDMPMQAGFNLSKLV